MLPWTASCRACTRCARGDALFWVNNIIGTKRFEEILPYLGNEARERWLEHEDRLDELRRRYGLYQRLCSRFVEWLAQCDLDVLRYGQIFGDDPHPLVGDGRGLDELHPHWVSAFDTLVRDTMLPSEDLEIVVAAERVHADIFVTEDKRLMRCAWSLGLNQYLGAPSFCLSDDASYAEKVRQCLEGEKFAEWPE